MQLQLSEHESLSSTEKSAAVIELAQAKLLLQRYRSRKVGRSARVARVTTKVIRVIRLLEQAEGEQ
jgi:hypothetical protein